MFCSRAFLEGVWPEHDHPISLTALGPMDGERNRRLQTCLLYTSDAADDA